MGRPSKLTTELAQAVCELVLAGNFRHVAAAAVGIHRNTLHNWEVRGEAGEEPYAEFLCDLQKAEARAEVNGLEKVRAGGEGWQSDAWWLERKHATRWSGRVRQQVSEELGAFAEKVRKALDEDTYRKVVDATREDASASGDAHH